MPGNTDDNDKGGSQLRRAQGATTKTKWNIEKAVVFPRCETSPPSIADRWSVGPEIVCVDAGTVKRNDVGTALSSLGIAYPLTRLFHPPPTPQPIAFPIPNRGSEGCVGSSARQRVGPSCIHVECDRSWCQPVDTRFSSFCFPLRSLVVLKADIVCACRFLHAGSNGNRRGVSSYDGYGTLDVAKLNQGVAHQMSVDMLKESFHKVYNPPR